MSDLGDPDRTATIAELRRADLRHRAPAGVLRRFRARLVDVEPRTTVQGVPWGVLCLAWSGLTLRCPLFPTEWARSPELTAGDVYRVVGTVEFRDFRPVVRVLRIEESLRLLPSGHQATSTRAQ